MIGSAFLASLMKKKSTAELWIRFCNCCCFLEKPMIFYQFSVVKKLIAFCSCCGSKWIWLRVINLAQLLLSTPFYLCVIHFCVLMHAIIRRILDISLPKISSQLLNHKYLSTPKEKVHAENFSRAPSEIRKKIKIWSNFLNKFVQQISEGPSTRMSEYKNSTSEIFRRKKIPQVPRALLDPTYQNCSFFQNCLNFVSNFSALKAECE